MGMIGTFDGFTTARLGIYAAQHGLRVTGNNISNINTTGYTRQRIEQESMKVGGADMYRSQYDNHVGNGAIVTGINQIRDPYLDIQFRNQYSNMGHEDAWLSALNDIARTLDEVGRGMDTNKTEEGDGILYNQLRDLRDMLMQLHEDPCKANDTLVRNSAQELCHLFNAYANALETQRKEQHDSFTKELAGVNEILTNIRSLNEAIRNAEIVGDNALELRDERNRQIDDLSEYMHIKVEYVMEDIGAGKQVEKLKIYLGNSNPDPEVHTDETLLIDGIYGSQLQCLMNQPIKNVNYDPNGANDPAANPMYWKEDGTGTNDIDEAAKQNYVLRVTELVDSKNILPKNHNEINIGRPVQLADNDIHGALQAWREMLTEKGEFSNSAEVKADPEAAHKRGLPYYQLSLDLLARQFATTYNKLNQGVMTDQDGNILYEEVDANGKNVEDLGLVDAGALNPDNPGESTITGYYVDQFGYYVGQHGGACLMLDAQLNANDTLAESMKKLTKVEESTWANDAAALLDANGEVKDVQQAMDLLKNFMGQHAVSQGNGVDADGNFTGDTVRIPKTPEGMGNLFSVRNDLDDTVDKDGNGITASNISVSHSWSTGAVKVVPKFVELFGGDVQDSTQNTNIDHMITKIDEALIYNPRDLVENAVSEKLFEGGFNDMFSNMQAVLADDQRATNVDLNSYYNQVVEIDTSRDGVSGVDLNDEAMNIMMYQKAYSAACRMMTAIDEAIDRLINNTGLAGR